MPSPFDIDFMPRRRRKGLRAVTSVLLLVLIVVLVLGLTRREVRLRRLESRAHDASSTLDAKTQLDQATTEPGDADIRLASRVIAGTLDQRLLELERCNLAGIQLSGFHHDEVTEVSDAELQAVSVKAYDDLRDCLTSGAQTPGWKVLSMEARPGAESQSLWAVHLRRAPEVPDLVNHGAP